MQLRIGTVGVLMIVLAVVLAGCDSAPLLAPSESTIVLSTSSAVIPSGGSTTLTAFVTESAGTPVQNGTTVRFTTNLGRLEPAEAQTRNGVATTTFVGDSGGVATVNALSGASAATAVSITVGTAAVTGVALQASPAALPPSGGTSRITAVVTGANNIPLSGIVVNFSTTTGTLSASTATTDSNGQATVTLTGNRAATVTARVGSVTGEVNLTVLAAASVTLAVSPESVSVNEPVTLTVTPNDGTAPNVTVDWGDGTNTTLGTVSSARTLVHRYATAGTFVITATATDDGQSITTSAAVRVSASTSGGPTISVTPTSLTGNTTTIFRFTITPDTSNGAPEVEIDFGDGTTDDLGTISSATPTSHTFTAADTYTVRVTQTDSTGATKSSAVVITVN